MKTVIKPKILKEVISFPIVGVDYSIKCELYPIKDNEKIPSEALDPKIWDIPEGYYAIKTQD